MRHVQVLNPDYSQARGCKEMFESFRDRRGTATSPACRPSPCCVRNPLIGHRDGLHKVTGLRNLAVPLHDASDIHFDA